MRRIILTALILGVILLSCNNDKPEFEPDVTILETGYYSFDLKSHYSWFLSSVPKQFPESNLNNDLSSGFNRAKIAWYKIDPLFLRNNSLTPNHILNDFEQQSNHFVREIFELELFPEQETEAYIPNALQVLNLAYYPKERGPYNYDSYSSDYSEGINSNGLLNNPESRWGGIQKEMFDPNQVFDTLDFWLMDPFVYNENIDGDLFIDFGDISEDVLKDSRISFEGGLPSTIVIEAVDSTAWGRVSNKEITFEFDHVPILQDVGLDGLRDEDELSYFSNYLNDVYEICNDDVYGQIVLDPSNDNFLYYICGEYEVRQSGILERYKRYKDICGNSSGEAFDLGTKNPDNEDINGDYTLQSTNNYVEYKVSIRNSDFKVGQNNIVEKRFGYNVDLANGEQDVEIAWYHFKIPINEYSNSYGFAPFDGTARTIRIYLTNFEEEVILRFATFNLVGYVE